MSNKQEANHTFCPYYAREKGDCRMTAGGLYIPLQRHIETYCLTSSYGNCQHFIKGKELLGDSEVASTMIESGRRRYLRKKRKLPIALKACDSAGKSMDLLDLNAFTVDLSQGGMRLETRSKLPVSSYIAFVFGKELVDEGLEGMGQVRWCSATENKDVFEAGIAFASDKIKKIMNSEFAFQAG